MDRLTEREELTKLLKELEADYVKEEDYETAAACIKMIKDMENVSDKIVTEKLQWIKVLVWCTTLGDDEIIDWM